MNSCLDIIVTGISTTSAEQMCSEMEQEAFLFEKILSCHDPQAETYHLNQTAFQENVSVSPILWQALSECIRFHSMTSGYFDAGLKKFKNGSCINTYSIEGISNIILESEGCKVRFTSLNTALDFGGIGKGMLLKEIEKILDKYMVDNCFISFGGSSILTRGSHPHGTSWPLAMREELPVSFQLNDHCVSFSGAFNQESYHIVNPKNLMPVESTRMTYIQNHCPVEAEVLSTALILAEICEAEAIAERFKPEKAFIFERNTNQELSILYSYESAKQIPKGVHP